MNVAGQAARNSKKNPRRVTKKYGTLSDRTTKSQKGEEDMQQASMCSANLFVDPLGGRKDHQGLTKILSQFGIESNEDTRNLKFDLTGITIEEVKENLVSAIARYLDPNRRSCLMFFSDEGKLFTIIIQDGKTLFS